jgi:predicted transcriptional regulator
MPEILASLQQDFPVMEEGRLVGLLRRDDVLRELARGTTTAPIGSVMRRELPLVDPAEMVSAALEKLAGSESRSLLVVRDGKLVGMLVPESVGWLLATRKGAPAVTA